MKKKTIVCFLLLGMALSVLGGCAKPAAPKQRILWPPLPAQPRVEWLGVYYSQDSFPKTKAQEAQQKLLGLPEQDFFDRAYGIAAEGSKIYVSDATQKVVKIYDLEAREITYLTEQPFNAPLGLALDSQGRIYVVDAVAKNVQVFAADKRPLFSFGAEELQSPSFLAIDEELGRIYVSYARDHKVAAFDMQGKFLFTFGEPGEGEGQLYSPVGLAVGPEGNVFVAEQWAARVSVFDAEGNFLRNFGERGDQQGQFDMPKGLAFDSDGNLHVTDARQYSLKLFSREGDALLHLGGGEDTTSPLSFGLPIGVWVDSEDKIYVADALNRRFVIWQYFSEAYLSRHPEDRVEGGDSQ